MLFLYHFLSFLGEQVKWVPIITHYGNFSLSITCAVWVPFEFMRCFFGVSVQLKCELVFCYELIGSKSGADLELIEISVETNIFILLHFHNKLLVLTYSLTSWWALELQNSSSSTLAPTELPTSSKINQCYDWFHFLHKLSRWKVTW